MTVATPAEARSALNDAMEIVALTEDRARSLVAPVLEEILGLRDYNVPERKIKTLIDALRACCRYNDALTIKAQRVSRALDQITSGTEPGPLTVRAIVNALRPVLRVLRDPRGHTASEYVNATARLREIVATAPRDRLLADSVRHNLGGAAHDLVIAAVDAREPVVA